jgi:hypothetical protein
MSFAPDLAGGHPAGGQQKRPAEDTGQWGNSPKRQQADVAIELDSDSDNSGEIVPQWLDLWDTDAGADSDSEPASAVSALVPGRNREPLTDAGGPLPTP